MPNTACIFCGNTAEKSTGEHVFPNWLRDHLGLSALCAYELTAPDGTARRWRAKAFDQRVRDVCDHCNSGWMAKLEGDTASVIKPMLRGGKQRLGRARQQLLATWATKTALMVVRMNPSERILPVAEHQRLYDDRRPSGGTVVWLSTEKAPADALGLRIAQAAGRNLAHLIDAQDGSLPDATTDTDLAGLVMFTVQDLVVAVLMHDYPGQLNLTISPDRPSVHFEDHFRQVWPISPGQAEVATTRPQRGRRIRQHVRRVDRATQADYATSRTGRSAIANFDEPESPPLSEKGKPCLTPTQKATEDVYW